MKTNAGKYLKRPIGENEEELLEEIWNSLPPVENDDQMLDENYRNVKQRIHKHTFRRRIIYISSSAAAVCLFILLLFSPESSEKSPVFAQLNDMGISISEQKVQFMIGDSIVANLNTSARMNVNPKRRRPYNPPRVRKSPCKRRPHSRYTSPRESVSI